jgi:hypothetical protein
MKAAIRLRRLARWVLDNLVAPRWGAVAGRWLQRKIGSRSRILVCDIDNTLAATREFSVAAPMRLYTNRFFGSLPPIAPMVELIRGESAKTGTLTIYLTARPFSSYTVTRRWLAGQGLLSGASLVVVPHPRAKVEFMTSLTRTGRTETVMVDDLSFDVDGRISVYESEAAALRRLPIILRGLDFITEVRQETSTKCLDPISHARSTST